MGGSGRATGGAEGALPTTSTVVCGSPSDGRVPMHAADLLTAAAVQVPNERRGQQEGGPADCDRG